MGKKKGGDNGQSALLDAQRKSEQELRASRNKAVNYLDTGYQEATKYVNPLLPSAGNISQRAFSNIENMDSLVGDKVKSTQEAYLRPAQRAVNEKLNNLFGRLGVGGRYNSQAQQVTARYADEIGLNEAMRQYELENQVRDRFMNENAQQYEFAKEPIQYAGGLATDAAGNKANVQTGTAAQLSNVYSNTGQSIAAAQAEAQRQKQAKKASTQAMIGGGLGAVGKLAGSFIPTGGK